MPGSSSATPDAGRALAARQGLVAPFEPLALVRDVETWQLAGLHLSFIAGTSGAPPIPGQQNPR